MLRQSWRTGSEPSFIAETSFVRAPLNSRVGASASIPNVKGKAKEDVLNHLPVDVQEALILEDLLYVLMVRLSIMVRLDAFVGNWNAMSSRLYQKIPAALSFAALLSFCLFINYWDVDLFLLGPVQSCISPFAEPLAGH